jgi:hypothetical protein
MRRTLLDVALACTVLLAGCLSQTMPTAPVVAAPEAAGEAPPHTSVIGGNVSVAAGTISPCGADPGAPLACVDGLGVGSGGWRLTPTRHIVGANLTATWTGQSLPALRIVVLDGARATVLAATPCASGSAQASLPADAVAGDRWVGIMTCPPSPAPLAQFALRFEVRVTTA